MAKIDFWSKSDSRNMEITWCSTIRRYLSPQFLVYSFSFSSFPSSFFLFFLPSYFSTSFFFLSNSFFSSRLPSIRNFLASLLPFRHFIIPLFSFFSFSSSSFTYSIPLSLLTFLLSFLTFLFYLILLFFFSPFPSFCLFFLPVFFLPLYFSSAQLLFLIIFYYSYVSFLFFLILSSSIMSSFSSTFRFPKFSFCTNHVPL